jgi:hypothetical protein
LVPPDEADELLSSDDDDEPFEVDGPLVTEATRDLQENEAQAHEAEEVVPRDQGDCSDDEGTLEDDISEFVDPDGVFANVEENDDLEPEGEDEASRSRGPG